MKWLKLEEEWEVLLKNLDRSRKVRFDEDVEVVVVGFWVVAEVSWGWEVVVGSDFEVAVFPGCSVVTVFVHLLQNLRHGAGMVLEVCSCRFIVDCSESVFGGDV